MNLINRRLIWKGTLGFGILVLCGATLASASTGLESISNKQLTVTVPAAKGSYEIREGDSEGPVLRSLVGAQVDHRWLTSANFPKQETVQETFSDSLGKGRMLTTTYSGLPAVPSLVCIIRLYDDLPFGDIEVKVNNSTDKNIAVQSIRSVEAIGAPLIDLGSHEDTARVLSDTFSENEMKIYDLGGTPKGIHLGVGSQLIYNRESGRSLFLGAVSSHKFPVLFDLRVKRTASGDVTVVSYTADSTGTTELFKRANDRDGQPNDPAMIELSLPVGPGAELHSERLMFAVGPDYHSQLETYGHVIRQLFKARVDGSNMMGWWSWTDYYMGISEGTALTNAHWLATHLKSLGFNYLLIDEGYQYARGEYVTPDATQFPHGLFPFGREISGLGLKLGLWTAPFEVSERAWVYQKHKDWLVHDAMGSPLRLTTEPEGLYVLDATNPSAQAYIRETYRLLTREWGARYIKLDFMDDSAIEGYRYRPNTTALEAQRIGLEVIRSAVGEDVLLDKDGSPMLNPVGIVDEGRISEDEAHVYSAIRRTAEGIAARYYMNRNFFVSDPDAFAVSPQLVTPDQARNESNTPLTLMEARASIVVAAISGGMFEIGDDLPALSAYPDRLALVENKDLIHMSQLGRASVPLDLLTYRAEDEQPSVFLLHEDRRQAILAVFNWTETSRSRSFPWSALGLSEGGRFEAIDVIEPAAPVSVSDKSLEIKELPPHSVRLIKIIDTSIPSAPPKLYVNSPNSAAVGQPIELSASCDHEGVPALSYRWDFGDGTSIEGPLAVHTYTTAGTFQVKVSATGVDGIDATRTVTVQLMGSVDTRFNLKKNRRYTEPFVSGSEEK